MAKPLSFQRREAIAKLWELGLCGGCIGRIMGVSSATARDYRGWKRPKVIRRYYGEVSVDWKPEELKRLEALLEKRWEDESA